MFAVTLAVKVTDWHAEAGLAELVSVVVVDAETTWVTVLVQTEGPSLG
jgi:hypothetical protein